MMNMLILADASPKMGTGHVMRCIALAEAALKAGMECSLLCRSTVEWLNARIHKSAIPARIIVEEPPARKDAGECIDEIGRYCQKKNDAWIVLDGYHFSLECQNAIRNAGYRLLLIDDYKHLSAYSCDILLNQNVCSRKLPYSGDIGKKLMGPQYALLRQEFAGARANVRQNIDAFPCNILINLGGGDFLDVLADLANSLNLRTKKKLKINIIRGAMLEAGIKRIFAGAHSSVEILGNVENMASLLLNTDLCVTAGGSTCWELCCLGVPFMTVEIAENQREVIRHMAEEYGILPVSPARLDLMLTDINALKTARDREMAMIDGKGAERVVHEFFK